MAYTLDEEDEEQQQGMGGGMAPPLGSAPMGGAPVGGSPAQAAGKPQQGSGFVGWDQILNANKDQASAQAGKLAGTLGAAGQKAQAGIGTAQANYATAAAAGMPTPANVNYSAPAPTGALPTAGSGAKPSSAPVLPGSTPAPTGKKTPPPPTGIDYTPPPPAAAKPVAPVTPSSMEKPSDAVAPPTSISETGGEGTITPEEAKRLSEAKFTGPKAASEMEGWDAMLSGAKDAQGQVKATQQRDEMGNVRGEAGIAALLQGNAPVASAANKFDAALVGATGRKRFNQLNRDYGGLVKSAETLDQRSMESSARRAEEVGRSAAAAQGKLQEWNDGAPERQRVAAAKAETESIRADTQTINTFNKYQSKYGGGTEWKKAKSAYDAGNPGPMKQFMAGNGEPPGAFEEWERAKKDFAAASSRAVVRNDAAYDKKHGTPEEREAARRAKLSSFDRWIEDNIVKPNQEDHARKVGVL